MPSTVRRRLLRTARPSLRESLRLSPSELFVLRSFSLSLQSSRVFADLLSTSRLSPCSDPPADVESRRTPTATLFPEPSPPRVTPLLLELPRPESPRLPESTTRPESLFLPRSELLEPPGPLVRLPLANPPRP
jgi:hypothetical protein